MTEPEAWVSMPTTAELRAFLPTDAHHPYDFGFFPAMARLIAAHPRIAPSFATLFGEVMFGNGALDRAEREMVAAVAAAAQDCFY